MARTVTRFRRGRSQLIGGPRRRRAGRGQATQVDFLTAIVIVIGAIGLAYIGFGLIIDAQSETVSASATADIRAQDRVVEDLLVNRTGEDLLAPGCTRAFFTGAGNATCSIPAGSGPAYLRQLVGIGSEYNINVTVRNESGIITVDPSRSGLPFRHAAGDPYPTTGGVVTFQRLVSYGTDIDGDGQIDHYRAIIRVWEEG